jgi:hypothetical protein
MSSFVGQMLPIVFIHTGTSFYLPTTLLQAAHASPRTERHLLGDWGSLALSRVARRHPLHRYWRRASELGRVFKNYSSNPAAFELICLQRWLALAEYMKAHGIDQCLYLDSDIMLYSDVELAHRTVPAQAGMTIAGISGHTNWVQKRDVLEHFGDYILDHYTRPGGLQELEEKYHLFRETHPAGGISDMTFFVEYQAAYPDRVADISKIVDDATGPTVFDITMDYTAYFEAENGLKAIQISPEGHAYGTERGTGRQVRFHTLHFQGDVPKLNLAHYATTPARARHELERQNGKIHLAYKAWRKLNRR